MALLTIQHVTTYRYRQPVAFGEHRLMFRPRDTDDQKVKMTHLAISPAPSSLDFVEDIYGNQIGVARFSASAAELRFKSVVDIERSPQANTSLQDVPSGMFPVTYVAAEIPASDLHRAPLFRSLRRDRHLGVRIPATDAPIGNFQLLVAMTRGIRDGLRYQRREEKGIQKPQETLHKGQGSCRDFAMLMIEGVRSLGFAARFASGYLAASTDHPSGGATHAWAQVYLPGVGWVDFDPTNGTAGPAALVIVAVARAPHHALPLHGTYFGAADDHLGMDVDVRVSHGAEVTDTKEAS